MTGKRGRRFRDLFRRLLPGSREKRYEMGDLISFNQDDVECPVCILQTDDLLRFTKCGHYACVSCWCTFVTDRIENFAMACITCVECAVPLPAATVLNLLTNRAHHFVNDPRYTRMLQRYEEFLLRQALSRERDIRWCPTGCGYGLIANSFEMCPQIICANPECGSSFCYKCHKPWSIDPDDPHLCSAEETDENEVLRGLRTIFGVNRFRRQTSLHHAFLDGIQRRTSVTTRGNEPTTSAEGAARNLFNELRNRESRASDDSIEPFTVNADGLQSGKHTTTSGQDSFTLVDESPQCRNGPVKPCPNCKTLIQKLDDGSCNSMVCTVCGYEFCWLCLRQSTTTHYFNFSGCTVWGQRRWTKLRRAGAILGLLLATPIIVPVVVIVGIPAISIGLTVFITKQVYAALSTKNKHSRRAATIWSIVSSLILFPVLTTLGMGIVIPIVLGYIYLYLPINLICSFVKNKTEPETGSTTDDFKIFGADEFSQPLTPVTAPTYEFHSQTQNDDIL